MKFIQLLEALDELPMDEESRFARAQQLGFDTSVVYYHGSPDARGIHQTGFEPKYGAGFSY